MEKFTELCDDLDVRVGTMDASIASTTASTTGESEVDSLMDKTAAEIGMNIEKDLVDAGSVPTKDPATGTRVNADRRAEQELEERLRKLRADPLAAT